MNQPTRIVILGGGFAGVHVALRLEQRMKRTRGLDVTLLDSENFFTFTPLLPEVPSGSIQPKHIVFPLRALLRKTHVRQAEVLGVDLERKSVLARHCGKCGQFTVPFDHLVFAMGSVSTFFGTPGVREYARTIKSLADAAALHAHLVDKLEHADLTSDVGRRRELVTFVVAGGGFAGVETVAELNDFVRGSGKYYPNVRPDDIRVMLVHSGDRILPEVSASLSTYACDVLRKKGIEVRLGTKVAGCSSSTVRLTTGEEIPCGTFIWAAGVAPHPILSRLDLPRTPQGKIQVDATMAVNGYPGFWAIGDSAAIPDVLTGKLCPPTAQFAIRQGRCLGDNLVAAIEGKTTCEFVHRSQGLLAGLGRRCAVAEVFGLKFSGFLAWWLWRSIYLLKLPGLERKLRVAMDWTLDLMFPRDIVYLRSLHEAQKPDPPLVDVPTCRIEHRALSAVD
ncbi:MAG: NAD(P)/FAD-dependent oxidoreductase [Planctomycetota bacterium]